MLSVAVWWGAKRNSIDEFISYINYCPNKHMHMQTLITWFNCLWLSSDDTRQCVCAMFCSASCHGAINQLWIMNHQNRKRRIRHRHITCHESCLFDSVLLACAPTHWVPSQIWWSAAVLCPHVAKTYQAELNNNDLVNTRCSSLKCLLIFLNRWLEHTLHRDTQTQHIEWFNPWGQATS